MPELPELDGTLDPNSLTLVEVILAVMVVVAAGFASRFVRRRVRQYLGQADGLGEGVPDLLGRLAGWSVLLFGFILALTILGFDTSGLVLLIGLVAIIAIVAGKDIVENFAAGMLLQVRGPFRVGDRVHTKGYTGIVQEINARSVVIETSDRRTVHVPNSDVLDEPIVNYTDHPVRRSEVAVGIAYDADVRTALALVAEATAAVEGVYPNPAPQALLHDFGDSSVDLVAQFWHDDGERLSVRSHVALSIKHALDDAGIEIPFPQRVIHTDDGREVG